MQVIKALAGNPNVLSGAYGILSLLAMNDLTHEAIVAAGGIPVRIASYSTMTPNRASLNQTKLNSTPALKYKSQPPLTLR